MKNAPLKAAVLISGTGSNLKALIDAIGRGQLNLDIVQVVSNRPEAAGLGHARAAAIPFSVIDHTDYPDRQAHDAAVADVLQRAGAELVVLAGYMRILGEEFANKFAGRMINLHPSLLPLYKGLDTYDRALDAGDTETGASIHFVTAGLDSGPVITQIRIPILQGDDAATLKARLGPLEHELLVATVRLFCERKIHCTDSVVSFDGKEIEQPLQLKPGGSF
ncbi:MAG: phosphoribosylglycinamide formyltransferase [Xanthomonadales bacterium]|nr:phosphoribosylglycinamide formyltransferase [Gammaproteobacteria bacterium]MBT8074666.1 phosphoribosylglycinamide formyltransferase [Gammaproteobacteria bacterium]MBT8074828.1 phosphoribosylglycinamide formyltransferase [Gammaproteobacteria bacterium]NNK05519.1 phosphoribosylglycinamide formyltransferase [Xanthomonadales bacterium]NNK97956.1 phosphoribosylglycinamide formyltransferase [Xanthomonadales bacterium]